MGKEPKALKGCFTWAFTEIINKNIAHDIKCR